MYAYTICFIKRGEELLLLNRLASPNMGMWNGVGGKLLPQELPEHGVLREVYEETGISLSSVVYRRTVTWSDQHTHYGGMHLCLAELPSSFFYPTPRATAEGILDWKPISWVFHPNNMGVVSNLRLCLPHAFGHDSCYEYACTYDEGETLVSMEIRELQTSETAKKMT